MTEMPEGINFDFLTPAPLRVLPGRLSVSLTRFLEQLAIFKPKHQYLMDYLI